jgi:hypothetical protein
LSLIGIRNLLLEVSEVRQAVARQELLNCHVLFHNFSFGFAARKGSPRLSPLRFTTMSPSIAPSTPDERAEWPVSCTTGWPSLLRK